MAITTNVGLISGFPIKDTVDQLVSVSGITRDRLKTATAGLVSQQSAVTDLAAIVISLQISSKKLGEVSVWNKRTVASSNVSALAATSIGTPLVGSYQFTPVQKASTHQLISSKFASETAPLGGGEVSFRFGGFIQQDLSLDSLNGGTGFQRGKIRVTDRSGASAEIDLSYAQSVEDVLSAINNNSTIQVRAETQGDRLRLVDETGLSISNLRVQEVGGTTAASLGLGNINAAADSASGGDIVRLFNQLTLSSINAGTGVRFDDAMADLQVNFRDGTSLEVDFHRLATAGTKTAATTSAASGLNGQIRFTAAKAGSAYDDVTIVFEDNPAITAGSETVAFDNSDPNNKRLVFQIDEGSTTANNVITALNNNSVAAAHFTAQRPAGSNGTGLIASADTGVTSGPQAKAITAGAANANLTFTAVQGGGDYDDVEIVFEDNPGITAGNETVVYDDSDPDNKRLVFQIAEGTTTADNIRLALANDPAASALFTAANVTGSNGSGLISTSDSATTTGGKVHEPVTATSEATLGELLATLNAADPARLQARISADGDRIELIDLTADNGSTFGVSQLNGSKVAEDLGLTTTASGDTLSGGRVLGGLHTSLIRNLDGGAGFGGLGELELTDRTGASTTVDLSGAETLDEVLETINASGLAITARVNSAGNGLELVDTSGASASNLIVADADGTNTATKLGLAVNGAVTSKNGGDLRLKVVSENTTLASLNGGVGISLGTFTVTDTNGKSALINVSSATKTLGGLIGQLNNAGLAIEARINDAGDGIALVDTGGGSSRLRVTEGNRSTAKELRLLGDAKTKSINGTPTQVIEGSSGVTIELEANESLKDLVTRINSSGLKVTANAFNDGSASMPLRFTLASQVSGRAGRLLIDTSGVDFSLSDTVRAQDALLLYGAPGVGTQATLASSSTNAFRSVVQGVSLEVKEVTSSPITVSITTSSTDAGAAMQASVDIMNRLFTSIKEKTAYNADKNTRGLLQGDSTVLRVQSDLSRLLTSRFPGLGSVQSLQELGVDMKDDGTIAFDPDKFKSKYNDDPAAVEEFLATKDTGFIARLGKLTKQLADDPNSLLLTRAQTLEIRITNNNSKIEFHDGRLEALRTRLLLQFQRMELAISKVQNNQGALDTIASLATMLKS